ncbi:MAG: hypothetical protein JXO72_11710 [Vicinamibacteria bacterium]|nr:hypothetical protein [Vicinamibacteria bacterium]
MSLKILVAGIDKEERDRVETAVKNAIGQRETFGPWTVSLVKIGRQWSVTLSGPEENCKNLSFSASDDRLGDVISEAIRDNKAAKPRTSPTTAAPRAPQLGIASPPVEAQANDVRDHHSCEACRNAFVVTFESQPGEAKVLTAVACPYCWHINRVEIGAWAASGHDFRAEKI